MLGIWDHVSNATPRVVLFHTGALSFRIQEQFHQSALSRTGPPSPKNEMALGKGALVLQTIWRSGVGHEHNYKCPNHSNHHTHPTAKPLYNNPWTPR